jgi:hypothetical protein
MFSPLNNVENSVVQTWSGEIVNSWNSLKGSWNLGLQAIGVGKGLLQKIAANPLANAAETNPFLAAARQRLSAATQNLVASNRQVIIDAPRAFDSISISGASGNIIVRSGGYNTLRMKSVSITAGGVLDLNDNDTSVDYTGASALGAIQSLITTGSIRSLIAIYNPRHNTTLGAMESLDYQSIYGPGATFNGYPIDSSAVLVKYTYFGDTDFNDVVNFDDYSRTDAGFNGGRSGWMNGDFDGNGVINFDDYSLIDLAFNTQA